MADPQNSLTEETLSSLQAAVSFATQNNIPYMLAKDLRQDYPHIKFDRLVRAVKDILTNSPSLAKCTPRVVVRHALTGNSAPPYNTCELDMREFLYASVKPYNWTEQDVHYRRLHARLFETYHYREQDQFLWYEAPEERKGYVESVEGLQPVLGELVKGPPEEAVVIKVEKFGKVVLWKCQEELDTSKEPSPELIRERSEAPGDEYP